MGDIDIIIADSDFEYIELFKKYIRESEYNRFFSIKSFTNTQTLAEFLEDKEHIEILLITPNFLHECDLNINAETIIVLTEMNHLTKGFQYREETLPHFFKYQPLNFFISEILTQYNHGSMLTYNKKTKVITVFSTTGGAGKTTVAINIARLLTKREKKVFYLNLESLSSLEVFFPGSNSYDLSKILYYLKTGMKDLSTKLHTLKKIDQSSGIEYFEAANANELSEMNKEELGVLLDSLISTHIYDFIILDIDSGIDERILEAFQKSDHILWLLLDNIKYLSKTRTLKKWMQNLLDQQYSSVYRRVKFILNRYVGEEPSNSLQEAEINLFSFLPYVPSWKVVKNTSELYNQDDFNEGITNIYNLLLKNL